MESYEDIDLKKVEKEKELQIAQQNLSTVEIAEMELGKKILIFQVDRKDLQIAISKAKQNVRSLTLEVKMLVSLFWRKKNV